MPEAFETIEKHCGVCGNLLTLNNNRDIQRKRFCSRRCVTIGVNPGQYVPPPSDETREKMRQSKIKLLAKGWTPVGWLKYPTAKLSVGEYVFGKHDRIHREIMENYLGRELGRKEVVHHNDGNKGNNNISNLTVMTQSEHTKYHCQRRMDYVTAGV